jgi:hypothetical protein
VACASGLNTKEPGQSNESDCQALCTAGSYSSNGLNPGTGIDCQKCPSGTRSERAVGSTTCVSCVAGTYSGDGVSVCSFCTSGTLFVCLRGRVCMCVCLVLYEMRVRAVCGGHLLGSRIISVLCLRYWYVVSGLYFYAFLIL